MPTLKGTKVSLPYVQYSLYLVSFSINASIFHITWLDTFWTVLILELRERGLFNQLTWVRDLEVQSS